MIINDLKKLSFLLLLAVTFTMTSCKDDEKLPQIDGYDSSDDVAKASLVAKWSFNDVLTESISGTAPQTKTGNSFTNGISGKALQLTDGYLIYPEIPAFKNPSSLQSMTATCWINVKNNGSGATNVFGITQGKTDQIDWNTGNLTMYLENGKATTYDDTLVLHGAVSSYPAGVREGADNINDYGDREVDFLTVKTGGTWVQYVLKYDGASSTIDLFANGKRVSNNKFRERTIGANPFGNLVGSSSTQFIVGAFPTLALGFSPAGDQSWQKLFNGGIDEIRVYNKALSESEISSLYQLELVGR